MKDFLSISKHNLDDELVMQPQLYDEYAEKLAEAESERDTAKLIMELYEAEADARIRSEEKGTENSIKLTIRRDEEYQRLVKNYYEAKKTAKKMEGVLDAIQQKKSSLENLIKLYLNNYYSAPNVSKDNKDMMEDRSRDGILEGLNKNERLLRRR